jgi:hypothetical protein
MAWSEITTKIANPARKAHHTMAKKLSAKQIKFFGTPRQKAALKSKRKRKVASRPKHRAGTKPNPPRKKRRIASHAKRTAPRKKKRVSAARRKNPGEIITFLAGNPARKRGTAVAKSRKTKRASSKTAGRRPKRKLMNKARRRKNPMGGGALPRPMEWAKLGVGGIGGGFLTRIIPQLAGASNTGPMGYAMNAAAAIAITLGVHMATKDKFLTMGAATGGAIALGLRIAGDYTAYGSVLALSGFGDYMVSNFVTPQRIVNPNSAIWEVPSGWGTQPAALPYGSSTSGYDKRTDGNTF